MKIILTFIMTIITSLFLITSFHEGFSELENTYVNEKCGVAIQYPEDWTVEEPDFDSKDKSSILAIFNPENDFLLFGVSIDMYNTGVAKRSMGEISKLQSDTATFFYPDSTIIESRTTEINGFPTHKIVYTTGIDGGKILSYLIIAYDREYELTLDATDKEEFDKYSLIVEEMANSIIISKPNFEGVNC